MNTEIKYSGYSAVPSDYDCADGTLALSLNLINEEGNLKPLSQPSVIQSCGDDVAACSISFIHKANGYTHYIIHDEQAHKLLWLANLNSTPREIEGVDTNYFSHLNAVGNTLILFTEKEMRYILWKDNNYVNLGNQLPNIELSFGLVGHPKLWSSIKENDSTRRGTFEITFNEIDKSNLYNEFTEHNKWTITEQVMAKVNKFIAEQTVQKGRFCFPFFIRWALRLYDGSHVNHSAPILMCPSTSAAPVVYWKKVQGEHDKYTSATLDMLLVAADIDYQILNMGDWQNLEKWQDIVVAVDVFISKPIYTYDQSGLISSFADVDNMQSKFIGKIDSSEYPLILSLPGNDFFSKYMEWSYEHLYLMSSGASLIPCLTLHLPEFSDDKYKETIENVAQFYKLCSIDIKDLSQDAKNWPVARKKISIADDYLQSISSREVLTDDYLSHDRLIANCSYNFNSRLNLSGVQRELFHGFTPIGQFAFCDSDYEFNINDGDITIRVIADCTNDIMVTVYVRDSGKTYSVSTRLNHNLPNIRRFITHVNRTYTYIRDNGTKTIISYDTSTGIRTIEEYLFVGYYGYVLQSTSTTENCYPPMAWGAYFFYPNVNAYKMVITHDGRRYAIDLKPHEHLNGAYNFIGFNSGREPYNSQQQSEDIISPSPGSSESDGVIINVQNKIYTSEVNNPFFFPLTGINTVGSGEILGICSAAKALSEGQFGQFPLYAFTTEGVWAMETTSQGTYSARQPITRDVCTNPKSITQLDSSVLFATDRGIILLSGSNASSITDILNTETPFDVNSLPHFSQLHSLIHNAPDTCVPTAPFSVFLKGDKARNIGGCGMIYDYVHQRVIVYNTSFTYAYVYSLTYKTWGMMYLKIKSGINSYPDALAVDTDNNLVSFSTLSNETQGGLAITRPLKLGAPDVLKTIDTVIQRGMFAKGHVSLVLWGSRDLVHWHPIWSSKDHYLRGFSGTPYKYFRLGSKTDLSEGESISGATIEYKPRETNLIR